ncbi:hypothetical protein [Haloarcula sp. K1]|uniref:hypothetical protein n=1 Tax=Haloarcula sp. K1 TaxID=1622207 RepID=UPI0007BB7FA8|nr:hypothetical protein [Haloarcula sp. K1]KZX46357.1 hypothetical protein AV929_16440 [Haloarcula sp. K1]
MQESVPDLIDEIESLETVNSIEAVLVEAEPDESASVGDVLRFNADETDYDIKLPARRKKGEVRTSDTPPNE